MAEVTEALGAEFDAMMLRAGLAVPAAQRAAILPGYAELREHLAVLRGLPASAEPSNTFRLHPLKAV